MHTLHDLGYSVLFSNKVIFRQLLQTFVKQPWVEDIDFDQLEKLNKSFVSEEHRKHESDLIYKVKLNKKTAYIIVLIEFQSKVQRFMAVRVLHYMMSFYLDLLHQQPRKTATDFSHGPIQGDAKWTAPTNLHELIDNYHLLGEFCLQFKYFKIAENEFSPESLLQIRNIVSTIFLAETHYDIDTLSQELIYLFRTEDKQTVSLLFNWFKSHGIGYFRRRFQPIVESFLVPTLCVGTLKLSRLLRKLLNNLLVLSLSKHVPT